MQKRKKRNITDAEKKENEYYRCRKRLKYGKWQKKVWRNRNMYMSTYTDAWVRVMKGKNA